ncbi:MAG: thioredoxin family protein [Alistipes indistinctus]
MMKKFLMVALFALMGATVLKAQNNGVKFIEDKPLSDVLAQAGKANKYAFVDVYATWCGPCKYMTSQVFPQAAAGDYFNKTFVNAKYDAEKGEGVTVAKTYRVTAYPQHDPEQQGRRSDAFLAGPRPEDFIARVKAELENIGK